MGATLVAAACGGDDDEAATTPAPVGQVELPFGPEQVEGTVPIGRPAVFDNVPYVNSAGS